MKFGEYLTANITPEWSSQYISYEDMKIMLEQFVADAPPLVDSDDNVLREQYFLRVDEAFFEFSQREAVKVERFFAEKLAEAIRRLEALKNELEYSQLCQEQPNEHEIFQKNDTRTIIDDENRTNAIVMESHQESFRKPMSRVLRGRLRQRMQPKFKTKKKLKVAFSELYLMLVLLQNYQLLNFTGFHKIMEKHDKLFETTRGEEWRKDHIDTATFHLSTDTVELTENVETIYTDLLESGDRAEAIKNLQVPPLSEKQSPIVTFRLGISVGLICALLPTMLLLLIYLNESRSGKRLPWNEIFLLYRSPCLLILEVIFVGINIYGWSSSGVNHVLIFEVDPRNHLTYQRLLEIGTFLFVFLILSVIAFTLSFHFDFYPFLQPFIFVILLTLFLLNPLRIFYHQSRFWLLRKLRKVFVAPFFHVKFADFWLGEQFTSLELIFFDLEHFFCFYISDRSWWSSNLTSPSKSQGACCTGWSQIFLQTCLIILPSWFRFAQNLRRYRDTKHVLPHLVNAGKSATGFFVAITNSLRRATNEKYANEPLSNPNLYLWIIASIIGATYKLIWDLKMDWGFFDKNAGSNKYLRDQLIYSSKYYYYFAIIENVIFRYIWIINIFVFYNKRIAKYADLIGFIFGFIEVFRRFIWNFFRLENEHLNNCDEFRAIRDISIVPLTSTIDFAFIEYKLSKAPGIRQRRKIVPTNINLETEVTISKGRGSIIGKIFNKNRKMSTIDNDIMVERVNEIDSKMN